MIPIPPSSTTIWLSLDSPRESDLRTSTPLFLPPTTNSAKNRFVDKLN